MRSLTIPCLVALLASLAFAGSSQAATSIDRLYQTVYETEVILGETNGELTKIVRAHDTADTDVAQLYRDFWNGENPRVIRNQLDRIALKLQTLKFMLEECRSEVRLCNRVMADVVFEAEQLNPRESEVAGLWIAIKNCYAKMYAVESRVGSCTTDLLQLHNDIFGLYDLLGSPKR